MILIDCLKFESFFIEFYVLFLLFFQNNFFDLEKNSKS